MKKSNKSIAYFCMEYGLTSEFKIYSGGLGILAGDMVKSSNEMGMPITFIGILWQNGYNTQVIDSNGSVIDKTPHNQWQKYVVDTGKYAEVMIEGRTVSIKIWKHKDYPLFLLDTNLPWNDKYAGITANLYGSGGCFNDEKSERIAQEIVLGIGGVRALKALGIFPDVYHFNEGHPIFGALELVTQQIYLGHSFETSIDLVKKSVVFTTHTPISAGNESHNINALIHMGANCGLSYEQLKFIGGCPFNMTVAALRLSYISNAVAKLHSQTAQQMWHDAYGASPIIPITNGVNKNTWQDPLIDKAFKELSFINIYNRHMINKENLILEVFHRNNVMLDKNSLVIGFARRATEYKRWTLIFNDINRISSLFDKYNIQIIFSGKSHKHDNQGKDYISAIYKMTKKYPKNVIFLEDYNIELSKILVSGCDIWLNNPRRPLEACGTSGMKAALNGVLNLSILDGWWEEACLDGVNGWSFGNLINSNDFDDANSLYNVLETKVLHDFSNKDKWTKMMFASILTAQNFTSERMIIDYFNSLYNC